MTDLSALVGCEVRRLLLDHQVTLFLAQSPTSGASVSAQIIIDSPFRLNQGAIAAEIDSNRTETLPPLCRLLNTAVVAAQVDEDVLTISLDDGTTITIGPKVRGASWQLVGQGIPHLLAAPRIEATKQP